MAKFKLLLLDTCVILEIFALGIWEEVLKRCDVHISAVVVDEARYFDDPEGNRHPIDLNTYSADLTIHNLSASDLRLLTDPFGPEILDRLDPGEAELLAVLSKSFDPYQICSGDAIVFRILGAMKRSEQGMSLEEVLDQIGLTKHLLPQFKKQFRERWSRVGFEQGMTQSAFKRKSD